MYQVSKEEAFRRMDRVLARRERPRLIRNGTIIPGFNGVQAYPQLMVKAGDKWVPEVRIYS